MGRIKHQSRGPLSSIALACLLISSSVALPSQERKLGESSFEPLDLPADIAIKAPLLSRASGESGAAHARYLRQLEAAAVFEASRLAARARRERDAREDQLDGLDKHSLEYQSSHPGLTVSSDNTGHRHFQPRTSTDDSDDHSIAAPEAPIISAGANAEQHAYPRGHHHSHSPVDHTQGGHSEHWFEHHGLKVESHHHHHHGHHYHHHHGHHHHHHHSRERGKGPGPSRLIQVRRPPVDGDGPITLIAPPSAQSMVDHLSQATESEAILPSSTPNRMIKTRTVQGTKAWGGEQDNSGQPNEAHEAGLDRRGEQGTGSMNAIPGVIDLMQGSPDGEKLGGLSISSLPPNDTAPIAASNVFTLLIDSTPNLIDQATFFLHTFKDQSTLDHESHSTAAPRDLLVALETPRTPNDVLPERMCATFNPLETDVQVFGLALCMDQDSATNNRRMSQAFKYSPGTGVLTPYYGAEGARDFVLAAVNQRIQAMESSEEQSSVRSGWNGTGIYDLDPNAPSLPLDWANPTTSSFGLDSAASLDGGNSSYKSYSELDHFSATESTRSSKTTMAAASTPTPMLSVNDTSVPNHPLVIGGSAGEAASTAGEGSSLGVIMVFRSNMESDSWRRTRQDVDTPTERRKALANYQDIGITGKDATALDHWAVIDGMRSNAASKPASKSTSSGSSGRVANAGMEKTGTPVGYWSNSGISKASGEERTTDDVQSDEPDETVDSDADNAPPKPVLNVAYFGDSGRSAPVPPDEQADFARPILVADPLAKPHTLATADSKEPEEPAGDISPVFLIAPSYRGQGDPNSTRGVMATVAKDRVGPLGIPVDASD
ncbi:unnamed protein product [Rhizoctonia solani]|uniref:Uncharacterized protein n=1 Tax=Rhizoctonia solani TaxID=456999 RepID=A0A8H3AL67_9AGAM|nr:unnamed protein product [Rhizoctonia solani]